MTFGLDDRLRARENVFAREFEGEIVLLDLVQGVYYGLDPLATHVWKAMTAGRTLSELVPELLAEYDVEEPVLRADLLTLATEWVDKKLVEPAP